MTMIPEFVLLAVAGGVLRLGLGLLVLACIWGLAELIWLLMEMVEARNA